MQVNKELVTRFIKVEKSWEDLSELPENIVDEPFAISVEDISSILGGLRLRVEEALEARLDVNPLYLKNIQNFLTNLETYIASKLPSNPAQHLPAFLTNVTQISTEIDKAINISINEDHDGSFKAKMKNKLAEQLAKAEKVNRLLDSTKDLSSQNEVLSAKLEKAAVTSLKLVTTIQERDRQTSEASTKISETEKKSAELFIELEGNLERVSTSSNEIKSQQDELKNLSEKLKVRLEEVQELLEDANRHGLAGAFKTRKEELSSHTILWVVMFSISILGLCFLAIYSLFTVNNDWHQLLLKIPFSAPLVWLGWFSVKQYGYNRKMQEDYSFKVASAMSFQGYKNELSDDPELMKLLRQSAIDNFAENPIRVYEGTGNHGSPLHEIVDSLDEKKFNKVIELLKTLRP